MEKVEEEKTKRKRQGKRERGLRQKRRIEEVHMLFLDIAFSSVKFIHLHFCRQNSFNLCIQFNHTLAFKADGSINALQVAICYYSKSQTHYFKIFSLSKFKPSNFCKTTFKLRLEFYKTTSMNYTAIVYIHTLCLYIYVHANTHIDHSLQGLFKISSRPKIGPNSTKVILIK